MRVLLNLPLLSALSCLKSVLVINPDSYATELLVYILLEKYYKILFICCMYEMVIVAWFNVPGKEGRQEQGLLWSEIVTKPFCARLMLSVR